MQDSNDFVNGDDLLAARWNQIPSEIQNVIVTAGLALTSNDLSQLAKSVGHYMATGSYFVDTGAANAYVATPSATNLVPPVYADGFEVEMIIGNTNTGASQLRVFGLTFMDISDSSTPGTLVAGELVRFRFDAGSGDFKIVNKSSERGNYQVGDYVASFADDVVDRNWLEANGSEKDRVTYSGLYEKIGTSFGVGDGTTTFNLPTIPPLQLKTTNTVTFADIGQSGLPVGNSNVPVGLAVNAATKTVYVCDTSNTLTTDDLIYQSLEGTNPFTAPFSIADGELRDIAIDQTTGILWAIGAENDALFRRDTNHSTRFSEIGNASAVMSGVLNIAVNSKNGDVWIVDNTNAVFILKKGTTSFIEHHSASPATARAMAVNPNTGDVWIATSSVIYRSLAGVGAFSAGPTYPGTAARALAIDPNTGDIWVADTTTPAIYRSAGGTAAFSVVGTYPGGFTNPASLEFDYLTGDLYLLDNTGDDATVFRSPGATSATSIKWYINGGKATPIVPSLATVVQRSTQILSDAGLFNTTLLGTGLNRGILMAVASKAATAPPTAVTLNNVVGTRLFTQTFTDNTSVTFSVYYWADTVHPGTGTFPVNIQYADSTAGTSISVLELNNAIQVANQVLAGFDIKTKADMTNAFDMTASISNSVGKLGLFIYAGAYTATETPSFTEGGNLANVNLASNTDVFMATFEDSDIAATPEAYSVIMGSLSLNIDSSIYGIFAINGAQ